MKSQAVGKTSSDGDEDMVIHVGGANKDSNKDLAKTFEGLRGRVAELERGQRERDRREEERDRRDEAMVKRLERVERGKGNKSGGHHLHLHQKSEQNQGGGVAP